MDVEGGKSTLANQNTSGAKVLRSAQNAEQRLESEDTSRKPSRTQATTTGSPAATSGGHADVAPSYIDPGLGPGTQKPKGKNLKEGGFDDDPSQNVSFGTDIGTEKDPGRLAENKFAGKNAENPQEAALPSGGKGSSKKGEQPYGILQPEEEA
ncbi:predicted protein [Uncinocarpus reesii 1704]|uniref:Uncharacterized protein n=1 Tax=Uncinocarpus reesii (strain UAMH 1704) TaxID=336963 RepID=C4JPS9_UNCRE|nr:uncharacterized protein UREG_04572 [Uncinocarpus reesii 1704]EEP79726.1 predicted protein [Uncinocarpus reesii 1704]